MAGRFSVSAAVLLVAACVALSLLTTTSAYNEEDVQNTLCDRGVCKCIHDKNDGQDKSNMIGDTMICTFKPGDYVNHIDGKKQDEGSGKEGVTSNTIYMYTTLILKSNDGTYNLNISDQMLARFQIKSLKFFKFNKLNFRQPNLMSSLIEVMITDVNELELDSKAFQFANVSKVALKVENCSTVRLKEGLVERLSSFDIRYVQELHVSQNTFNPSEGSVDKIEMYNVRVDNFTLGTFGSAKVINLTNVHVQSIESGAFPESSSVENLQIRNCVVDLIKTQAIMSNVTNVRIENTTFKNVHQSAIELYGTFDLLNNTYNQTTNNIFVPYGKVSGSVDEAIFNGKDEECAKLFLVQISTDCQIKNNNGKAYHLEITTPTRTEIMKKYLNKNLCSASECECTINRTDPNDFWKVICEFSKNGVLRKNGDENLAYLQTIGAVVLKSNHTINVNLTINEGTFSAYRNLSTFVVSKFDEVTVSNGSLPIVKPASNLMISIDNVTKLDLGKKIVPGTSDHWTVDVSIKDCDTVRLSSEVVTNLRSFEIHSVNDLRLSENTFYSESVEKVELNDTKAKVFPKNAFASEVDNIFLTNVTVESIESNAFSNYSAGDSLKIINCTFNTIKSNAIMSRVRDLNIEKTKLMNASAEAINVYASLTLLGNTYGEPIRTIFTAVTTHDHVTVRGDIFGDKEKDVEKYFALSWNSTCVRFTDAESAFTISKGMCQPGVSTEKTTTTTTGYNNSTTANVNSTTSNDSKSNKNDQPKTTPVSSTREVVCILLVIAAIVLVGCYFVYYVFIRKQDTFRVSTANNVTNDTL